MRNITTIIITAVAVLLCSSANASECEYRGGDGKKVDCREFLRQQERQIRRQPPPQQQYFEPNAGYMNGVPIQQWEQQQVQQQQRQQQQLNNFANGLEGAGRWLQSVNPPAMAPHPPVICTKISPNQVMCQ
jgi:hypothetical protein